MGALEREREIERERERERERDTGKIEFFRWPLGLSRPNLNFLQPILSGSLWLVCLLSPLMKRDRNAFALIYRVR